MADPPKRRAPRPNAGDDATRVRPNVVRREPGPRRPIPPEAAAVDRGEPIWRARRPTGPRTPELKDPRAEAMVAGVANRAARNVYDTTVTKLRELRSAAQAGSASNDRDALGDALLDATRLAIWELRRVVDFVAFVEDVIGIPEREAKDLVIAAEARAGWTRKDVPPYARAVVLRARAALAEAALTHGQSAVVRATGDGAGLRITVDVAAPDAAAALAAIGWVLRPLAEDLAQGSAGSKGGFGSRGDSGSKGGFGPPRGRDRRG